MKYEKITEATFLERPNRFVARVALAGVGEIAVHVPNTGRCREIFLPNTKVYLSLSENPKRKYPYTLVSAYKGKELIHIHSAAANRVAKEGLTAGKITALGEIEEIKSEQSFLNSRFDFSFYRQGQLCYMEVKGVTLEEDGVARFPDAPTLRGTKHLEELIKAKEQGYGAYVLFVIQMKGITSFTPNDMRDPAFGAALRRAKAAGVTILAYDCKVSPQEVLLDRAIPVDLEEKI